MKASALVGALRFACGPGTAAAQVHTGRVPDPATGRPHLALGMVSSFDVVD